MAACTKCGFMMPEEARFCPNCGQPVLPAEAPAVTPEAQYNQVQAAEQQIPLETPKAEAAVPPEQELPQAPQEAYVAQPPQGYYAPQAPQGYYAPQTPQQNYYAPPPQAAAPPQAPQSYYAPQPPQQSYYAPQPSQAAVPQPPQQSYYAPQPSQAAVPPQAPQQYYAPQPQQAAVPQGAPQQTSQSYYAQPQQPGQNYYAQPQQAAVPPQGGPQQPGQNYYAPQPPPGAPQQNYYGYQQGPAQGPSYQTNPADIAENKGICVLCYLGILLLIPLLSKPNSGYVKYHSNQGLLLLILGILVGALSWIPYFGWVIGPLGSIAVLVGLIMGIVNATSGQMKPLPLIGKITLIR